MVVIIKGDNPAATVEEEKGTPHTAHTSSPVPVIILGLREEKTLRDGGSLRDLAPTMLELLEIEKPKEMTGQSLID